MDKSFFNLQEIQSDYESAYHLMIVKTKQKFSQKSKLKFFSFLKRNKVIFNVQYLPINMHRFYIQNQRFFYKKNLLNNSISFYEDSFCLPIYYGLNNKKVLHICKLVNSFFGKIPNA